MGDALVRGFQEVCGLFVDFNEGKRGNAAVESLVRLVEGYARFSLAVRCESVPLVKENGDTMVSGIDRVVAEGVAKTLEEVRFASGRDGNSSATNGPVEKEGLDKSGIGDTRCDSDNTVERGEFQSADSKERGSMNLDSQGRPITANGCLEGETTTQRNRRWAKERRDRRKEAKKPRESCQSDVIQSNRTLCQDKSLKDCSKVRKSLEDKWIVENELATERARRALQIIKGGDLKDEIRRRNTQVKRHTESNMVAIEKTHRYLSKTGNVAGEPAGGAGFAETIISDCPDLSSGSISPDSSASMQEFRAVQKQCLDQQQRIEKLEKAYRKAGGNPDAIDLYEKSLFTMEDGTVAQHYVDQFRDFNLSWGIPENAVEYRNGKKKMRIDFYGLKDDAGCDFYGDC